MPPSKTTHDPLSNAAPSVLREDGIEYGFIGKLQGLKYEHRRDIHDRATLEQNFREKFQALNRVTLTDAEFARLLDEIVKPDVFTASKTLRSINTDNSHHRYDVKRHRITDARRAWIEERYNKGWAKGYTDEQVKIFPREDFAYHKVSVTEAEVRAIQERVDKVAGSNNLKPSHG